MSHIHPAFDDGRCLILKRVRFHDGKLYDIRIRRLDPNGEEIQVNQNTPFSAHTLDRIQTIAADIFQSCPPGVTIRYQSKPEECESFNPDATPQTVSLMGGQFSEIVDGARQIHRLLTPELRAEVGESLLIYPKFSPPSRQAPPAAPLPPEEPLLRPQMAEKASTPIPVAEPSPSVTKEDLMKGIDEQVQNYRKTHDFLKDVTYPQLASYANSESRDSTDKLAPIYTVFKEVIKNPVNCTGQKKDMQEWITALYLEYYRMMKENEAFRALYASKQQTEDFDTWCKRIAATEIVGFILVEDMDISLLIQELMKLPLAQSQ